MASAFLHTRFDGSPQEIGFLRNFHMYYVALPFVLQPLGFEAREFLAGVGRPFVVAGEQDDEAAGDLDPVVHRPDEARAERDVVVLDEHFVVRAARTSATSCVVVAIEPRRLRKKSNLSATAPAIGLVSRRRGRQYGKDWTARARAIAGDRVHQQPGCARECPSFEGLLFSITIAVRQNAIALGG
jgi:hypothetical protein